MNPVIIAALSGALITGSIACIGWLVAYRNTKNLAILKERLDFINHQLAEFYGPLYISCECARAAVEALLDRLGITQEQMSDPDIPEHVLKEYHSWMKQIFTPLNDRREKIILEKSHLIREDFAPECLLTFVAHATTYRAIMAKWDEKDFSDHFSHIPYPEALDEYVTKAFAEIKREQGVLIGLIKKRSSSTK